MYYKLIGMIAWRGGKWFLRRKYGAAMASKPLMAGGLAALLLGGAMAARDALSDDSS